MTPVETGTWRPSRQAMLPAPKQLASSRPSVGVAPAYKGQNTTVPKNAAMMRLANHGKRNSRSAPAMATPTYIAASHGIVHSDPLTWRGTGLSANRPGSQGQIRNSETLLQK